ncbi:mite allergen Lep d 7 [Procambarus clarkii]|uniref:mite allergen Lep d 7 n=1 Tax=Procambarus clarkii TaxID=6728 RepID=UPI001E6778B2|nr:uncharacterized protein LOC123774582 [Procambarus clarkii]
MLSRAAAVIVLCLGFVATAPGPKDDSLNHYLDLMLDNLEVLIIENGLDPTPLPNGTVGFSDVVLGVTWQGEAAVYDGSLRGLSSIYRTGDAEFLHDGNGFINGISANLGLGDMEAHYTLLAEFMDLGPVADVVVDINGASIYFEASLDRTTCHFHVSIMEVTDIGHISVNITGLGLLDWIVEIVVDLVVNIIKGFIKDTVEGVILNLTNQVLDGLDLGVLGPLIGCDAVAHPFIQPRLVHAK